MKVRKAIIPAAGLGTRFLPATKAMPKEMLPIVDRPTIEFIVDEAIQSGLKDILIVTGKGKRAIEDHFDINLELEQNLVKKEKHEQLNKIKYSSEVEIHYIRQKEPKGLGHAIWCARNFIGNEPFAVLLGDDIVESSKPCLAQLIDQFDKTQSSIVGVQKVLDKDTERYGIIDPLSMDGRLYEVQNFVEKPKRNTAPSNLAIVGRYILTPEIFPILSCVEMDINGEIQLTDAIEKLNKIQRVFAYEFEGKRYDVGEKIGFIQATMEFALNNNEIGHKVEEMLKELLLKRLSKDEVNL